MGDHNKIPALSVVTSKSAFERLTGVADPDTIVLFSGKHAFPPEFPFIGYQLAKDWQQKGPGVSGDAS